MLTILPYSQKVKVKIVPKRYDEMIKKSWYNISK